MNSELMNMLQENLAPETMALMVAELSHPQCKDDSAMRQVRWFCDQLIECVGGHKAVNALFEEIGV